MVLADFACDNIVDIIIYLEGSNQLHYIREELVEMNGDEVESDDTMLEIGRQLACEK